MSWLWFCLLPGMKHGLIALLTILSLSLASANISPHVYLADMQESQWQVRTNKLSCELTHVIPDYGVARFEKKAGQEIIFEMVVIKASQRQQRIEIETVNPIWRSKGHVRHLGQTIDSGKNIPFRLKRGPAVRLLLELENGMLTMFNYKDAADGTDNIEVGLSPINFNQAHHTFSACLVDILPYGFDDVNFTRVNFQTNSNTLSDSARRALDKVIRYYKSDSTVQRIVLRGYTDAWGKDLYNNDLSRFRNYSVSAYLTQNGVPTDKIQHLFYGESQPIASNNTQRGRAKNRRVTVEIVRDLAPARDDLAKTD